MKEETKNFLLHKPSEMLAVDIKPLKFLDSELLCQIRQPAARAKCKCWWFQLADAARLHQVTNPVKLPLSRAVLLRPCSWTSLQFVSSLFKERSARGIWAWRILGATSTSDVSKAENKTNFCVQTASKNGLLHVPCSSEDGIVHTSQLSIKGWCTYQWLDICL